MPSYLWFFLKLAGMVMVFIWIRGTLPRVRVDQVMNFTWKFMLPMAFSCILAVALWHYAGRGLVGWLVSLAVVSAVYFLMTRVFDTRKRFATRVYRYAE